jgi:hypothetical protein
MARSTRRRKTAINWWVAICAVGFKLQTVLWFVLWIFSFGFQAKKFADLAKQMSVAYDTAQNADEGAQKSVKVK